MWKGNQDVKTFADSIFNTIYKAFLNCSQVEKGRQTINHFMWGLADNNARGILAVYQPETMQAALKLALVYQHSTRPVASKEQITPVRRVEKLEWLEAQDEEENLEISAIPANQ